jgi:hypothetical protein
MRSNLASAGVRTNDVPRTCSYTRILTVSTVHREWNARCQRRHSYVPAPRLNGHWLRRAGFAQEQKVRITVGIGTIIIALLDLTP